jgi:hypothetical protein
MGTPYGQYLQDDALAGRVQAKLFVLLTPWCMTAEQRQQLVTATRGRTRLWCYAPGYLEPTASSLDAMRELTGFTLAKLSGPQAVATPTPLGKQLGLTQPLGVPATINPLFAACDATEAETLATYSDGSAAIALRNTPDGPSLFVGVPGLSSELLRLAARKAGAHLYTNTDCNVYANGPYVVLHAAQDGPLEFDAGIAGPVKDLLTNEILGQGPRVTLGIRKGETRVLVVGSAP